MIMSRFVGNSSITVSRGIERQISKPCLNILQEVMHSVCSGVIITMELNVKCCGVTASLLLQSKANQLRGEKGGEGGCTTISFLGFSSADEQLRTSDNFHRGPGPMCETNAKY